MVSRMFRMGWQVSLVVSFLTSTAAAANPRTSNPSIADPDQALAVHGDEIVVALHDECLKRCNALAKAVPPQQQRAAKGIDAKLDADVLADAFVAIGQLSRLSGQLVTLGEPAGHEFGLRAMYYRTIVNNLIGQFKNSPPATAYINGVRQRLLKMDRPRTIALQKMNELVNKKNYEDAERVWNDYSDKLNELLPFLMPAEANPYIEPFSQIQGHVVSTMGAHRFAVAKDLLTKRRDAQRPNLAELTQQIDAAAKQLATAPQATIEGNPLTGPDTFVYFVGRWQKLHAAAIRCQGLHWALETQRPVMSGAPADAVAMMPSAGESKNDPVLDDYRNRAALVVSTSLAGLVEAEAARATPAEVPALYAAWLNAAAPVVGRVQNDALAKVLDPALRKLAARSPEFFAQVTAYDETTLDYLRWKRRTADAATAPFVTQQPALEATVQKAFTSDKEKGYTGLYSVENPPITLPTVQAPAPALLSLGGERLLKQGVILSIGQGLAGGKSNATRLRQRMFATCKPSSEALEAAVAALSAELFVTSEQPPLTLTATAALRSLQVGDYVVAGGEVTGMHLEGWITRLAGLPDAAWPLFALGDLPVHTADLNAPLPSLDKAVLRCEIDPKWLRHEYVIVPMPAPKAE